MDIWKKMWVGVFSEHSVDHLMFSSVDSSIEETGKDLYVSCGCIATLLQQFVSLSWWIEWQIGSWERRWIIAPRCHSLINTLEAVIWYRFTSLSGWLLHRNRHSWRTRSWLNRSPLGGGTWQPLLNGTRSDRRLPLEPSCCIVSGADTGSRIAIICIEIWLRLCVMLIPLQAELYNRGRTICLTTVVNPGLIYRYSISFIIDAANVYAELGGIKTKLIPL